MQIEQVLAEIWQQLLPVERIRRHDNFFELGGDSLSATRFDHAASQMAPSKDSLTHAFFFEAPTLTLFAAQVEAERDRQQEAEVQRVKLRRAQLAAEVEKMTPEEVASLWGKKKA